jgi:hypothetical protein
MHLGAVGVCKPEDDHSMERVILFVIAACFANSAHALSYSEAVLKYCRKGYRSTAESTDSKPMLYDFAWTVMEKSCQSHVLRPWSSRGK